MLLLLLGVAGRAAEPVTADVRIDRLQQTVDGQSVVLTISGTGRIPEPVTRLLAASSGLPYRMVLDFPGVTTSLAQTLPIGAGGVVSLHTASGPDGGTRMVADLVRPMRVTSERSENAVRIHFTNWRPGGDAPVPPAAVASPRPSAPAPIAAVAPAPTVVPAVPAAAPVRVSPAAAPPAPVAPAQPVEPAPPAAAAPASAPAVVAAVLPAPSGPASSEVAVVPEEPVIRAETPSDAGPVSDLAALARGTALRPRTARSSTVPVVKPEPPAAAPASAVAQAAPARMADIRVPVGSGLVHEWPAAASRLALADDTLLRLNALSPTQVLISGVKVGHTTLIAWLPGGERLVQEVVVEPNLASARAALRDMAPRAQLDLGSDDRSVVLRGEVASQSVSDQARTLVEALLPGAGATSGVRVVNLLQYPGYGATPEDRLATALTAVDPRIRVRRVQPGSLPDVAKDSYVLEGQVRTVNALVQAIVLAERQLGGTGTRVKSADEERVEFEAGDGSRMPLGAMGGGGGRSALGALQGGTPPPSGLAAQVARGLLLTSESGRVVSFLTVDALPQVLVSIRVLEIDRTKAKRLGVDLGFESGQLALNSSLRGGLQAGTVGRTLANAAGGNLTGSFVGATRSLVGAIDFLSANQAARSVSEPNLLTLSGEVASVLVGGSVPVPLTTANQVSVQTSFGFQQFGVRMDLRPTVDDNDVVALEVVPSIVRPTGALGNSGVPGFQIQRVSTTARVGTGESLLLGGLIKSSEATSTSGVPGLKWLPIFRTDSRMSDNSELVFLITPRIIEEPTPDLRLPPLQYQDTPSRLGGSGLDPKTGAPLTFEQASAVVRSRKGTCSELRREAGSDAPVVDCVGSGTTVTIARKAGSWSLVQTPEGATGWVAGADLRPIEERP